MARRKSTGVGWLVLLLIIVIGSVGWGAYYFSRDLGKGVKPSPTKPSVNVQQVEGNTLIERDVVLYMPKESANGFYLVPVTTTVSGKGDILDLVVKALLKQDAKRVEADRLFPEGTELLSPVKVTNGVAMVDLSRELLTFSGGSEQEALTLNSIAHTVVDNSGGRARKVQILVEGVTAETLGGHFEISSPIEADSTMLQPDS